MDEKAAAVESDPKEEALRVAKQIEEARAKLKKAEAFKLPELEQLRREVSDLEVRATELQAQILGPMVPTPTMPLPSLEVPSRLKKNGVPMDQWTDADWMELAEASEKMSVEKRFDLAQALGWAGRKKIAEYTEKLEEKRRAEEGQLEEQRRREEGEELAQDEARREEARAKAQELRSKLNFESIRDMTNEERFEVAKEVGPAYIVSLGFVAMSYWALSAPFLLWAYHESTGQWPDLGSLDTLGTAAGAFAGFFAVYALLKPVRLFVALLVTPWTIENVMPDLPRLDAPQGEDKK